MKKIGLITTLAVICTSLLFLGACQTKTSNGEETEEKKDSAKLEAYPLEVEKGQEPDYMKDVEAKEGDKDLDVKVDSSSVNINKVGEYPVTYTTTTSQGEEIKRTVNIDVYDGNKKVIYLTFDDGPSTNTPKILQILKENGVHATFFIAGHNTKYLQYLRQEAQEGHSVAAHTYSHNYNIYTSFDTYFEDLEKVEKVIEQYTGKRTQLIRFPGGSSNHAFANYNNDPSFMIKLSQEVQRRGYQYFDWNLASGDANVNHPNAATLVRNSCRNKNNRIILLFHDTAAKDGTVAALPTIIKYYKDQGYSFATLTSTSTICHHGIKPFSKTATATPSTTATSTVKPQKKAKKDSTLVAKPKKAKKSKSVHKQEAAALPAAQE